MNTHRGYFFPNFLNVAMGLALLPLLEKSLNPLQAKDAHVSAVTVDAVWACISPEAISLASEANRLSPEAIRIASLNAWKSASEGASGGLVSPADLIDEYISKLEHDPKLNEQTSKECQFGYVIKDHLLREVTLLQWLILLVLVLVILFVYEVDRTESLVLCRNIVPSWINFFFFASRIAAMISLVICSWRIGGGNLSGGILVVGLFSLLLHDLLCVVALLRRIEIPSAPGMFRRTVVKWVILDLLLVTLSIASRDARLHLGNYMLTVVVGTALVFRMALCWRFYFRDYPENAGQETPTETAGKSRGAAAAGDR
jgi:hypothetical protein